MKTKSKAALLIAGAVVLSAASVMGTIAYLTASKSAVNTFTVGKVAIDLAETDVDEDGDPLNNEYHLVPGTEYQKDPTMTVLSGSEEAYVRMILTVHNASGVNAILKDETSGVDSVTDFLGGMDDSKWILTNTVENTDNSISYEYRYFDTVANPSEEDLPLAPLFDTLIIPSTLDGETLQTLVDGGFKIVVEGHGIQATGFADNADAAWKAFDAQAETE